MAATQYKTGGVNASLFKLVFELVERPGEMARRRHWAHGDYIASNK
jgi:hypothetical protein